MKKYSITFTFLLLIATCPSSAQQVIFEDHFNGEELNSKNWSYEEGDGCPDLCGWGNNERQIYSRDFISIEDGKLVIEAVKRGDNYFSGKINTKNKFNFQYGTIEVRLKLPTGHGIWPAVWMLGTNIDEVGWPRSGEIDIMEYVGREPKTIYSSLHTPASHGDTENSQVTVIEDIEEGYHTFKTVWGEMDIQYFVDGEHVYTFTPRTYDDANYPFRHPFYILINMAVGGNFGGPEVDDAIFPAKFYVDYIKVTQE